jgi:hypothetical protein
MDCLQSDWIELADQQGAPGLQMALFEAQETFFSLPDVDWQNNLDEGGELLDEIEIFV